MCLLSRLIEELLWLGPFSMLCELVWMDFCEVCVWGGVHRCVYKDMYVQKPEVGVKHHLPLMTNFIF